jgi:hypothetical protein
MTAEADARRALDHIRRDLHGSIPAPRSLEGSSKGEDPLNGMT